MIFAEAVAYAKARRNRAQGFWLDPEATGPLGENALGVACAWCWRGIPGRREQMRRDLVDLAERDAKAQAWLRIRIAKALEAGEPVPEVFMQWLVAFLRDPSPPKGRGGRICDPTSDKILASEVAALVKAGLTRSRNDASPARSACDAVAEAWMMDWRAVEKAAKRGEALRRK